MKKIYHLHPEIYIFKLKEMKSKSFIKIQQREFSLKMKSLIKIIRSSSIKMIKIILINNKCLKINKEI